MQVKSQNSLASTNEPFDGESLTFCCLVCDFAEASSFRSVFIYEPCFWRRFCR